MDVVRLTKDSYIPDTLIEGYSSMIWTERYQSAGEFQMKTAQIAATQAQIPPGSFISLLDSREVMIVETSTIDRDADGNPELTVVGRSFETFYENRDVSTTWFSPYVTAFKSFTRTLTTAEQVEFFLWNDIVDNRMHIPNADWLSNIAVSHAATKVEARDYQELKAVGDRYSLMLSLLQKGGHGIRALRPRTASVQLVTFDVGDGTPIFTQATDVGALVLQVYDGVDRTRGQSVNTPVVLSYEAGDITSPQYIFTIKDYKNVADVSVAATAVPPTNRVFYADGASGATYGFDRRVLSVDATDIVPAETPNYEAAVQTRALTELAKVNTKVLFGAEIASVANYIYNKDYFLGDKVTLAGEYDFQQDMIVTEYVRTEDSSGDRGFPTLTVESSNDS